MRLEELRGVGAAASESKDRVIEQANAEYEAYTAGKLYRRLGTTDAWGGKVEYCGDEDDLSQWTVTYVRAHDNAVIPLACGDLDRALGTFERLDRAGVAFWSEVEVPPPVLLVDGVHHHFQPARGRVLLGVVELVERAVLLVAVDTRIVAVYREGGVSTVLPLGRPATIREIDLAHLLDYYGPRAEAKPRTQDEPLRPSPETQAHHIRIVRGRPIDVGAGPPLSEVLSAIFEDIEARATTPKVRPKKLKGKTWVPVVLKYLRELCVSGCRDLVGSTGKIIREIREECPEFQIKSEAFADALKLIAATGTGLIGPRKPRGRIWRINLAELADPTSALHKRLCRETADRPGVVAAANQTASAQREPPPSGRTAAPAEDAGPPRNQEAATAAEGKSGGDFAGDGSAVRGGPSGSGAPTPRDPARDPEHRPAALDAAVEAAALRLVDHFSTILLAGPMLLIWTLQTQGLAELGPMAANGGAEHEQVTAVKADSGRDQQLSGEADLPEGSEDRPHPENPVAPGATAVIDAERSDERRLEDGLTDAPAAEAPVARVALPVDRTRRCAWTPLSLPDWFVRPAARRVVHPRAPLGDADPIHRRQAFTLIQSELQRRALGTLGPRGPPAV